VAEEQAGQTLAGLVREIRPATSWRQARELCHNGRVWVDGAPALDPARRLAGGERVEIRLPRPGTAPAGRPQSVPTAAIVHLDADVAVVRKPAGLLTVPFERAGPESRDTLLALTRVAVRRLETARGLAHNPSLRAVQRLDKETSGLVVFARHVRAQRHLQEQFTAHTVTRRYLALVHGRAADATYDTLLVADRGDGLRGSWGGPFPTRRAYPGDSEPPEGARQAVTHVTVLEALPEATLVACDLETGRQHQIRIHLAEAGHPLVGERVYIRDWRGPLLPAPRPLLHAAVLGFVHPRTGKTVRFEEPPPEDFAAALARLRSGR